MEDSDIDVNLARGSDTDTVGSSSTLNVIVSVCGLSATGGLAFKGFL